MPPVTNRGTQGRIATRGVDSSESLGRHQWVVERTLAWLARYRRPTGRYEDAVPSSFPDPGPLHWG